MDTTTAAIAADAARSFFAQVLARRDQDVLTALLKELSLAAGGWDRVRYAGELMAAKDERVVEWIRVDDLQRETDEAERSLAGHLLPAKRLIVLSGLPKDGKTFIALEIARAVAEGSPLFGRHHVYKKGAVYYFDLENGEQEIAERCEHRGDQGHDFPIFYSFDSHNLRGTAGTTLLDKLPEPPRLIIIDSVRAGFNLQDENDASEMTSVLSAWREWSHENATVLLIHHNNKGGGEGVQRLSGSSALPAAVDGCMIIKQKNVMADGSLLWRIETLGRFGMQGDVYLMMDGHTNRVTELSRPEWDDARMQIEEAAYEERLSQTETVAKQLKRFTLHGIAKTLRRQTSVLRSDLNILINKGVLEMEGEYYVYADR